jgi:hypothetical protein
MITSGDIRRCVVLSREGVFAFSTRYSAAFLHAFVGKRRVT